MKEIIVILILLAPYIIKAQVSGNIRNYNNSNPIYQGTGHYEIVSFDNEGQTMNGIHINTQIPLSATNGPVNQTRIHLKGYDDYNGIIDIQVGWFFDGSTFRTTGASSTGSCTPPISIGPDPNGFLGIYFTGVFGSLHLEITGFAIGYGEQDPWYSNWVIDDNNTLISQQSIFYINNFQSVYAYDLNATNIQTNNFYANQSISGHNLNSNSFLSVTGRVINMFTAGNITLDHDLTLPSLPNINGNKVLTTDASGVIKLTTNPIYSYWSPHNNPNTIFYNGVVAIGNPSSITATTPINITSTYQLVVGGTIGANKLKITQQGWADYVFDTSYKLLPLSEVENFVKLNKHLPEVPSVTDIVKQGGLDVGENQVLLLKKIEELTLYILQQKKQYEQQQESLNILLKATELQNAELQELKNKIIK